MYNRTVSEMKLANTGDIVTMSGIGLIHLYRGDEVTLMVRDYGGTSTGTYFGGNVNIVRVGVNGG